MKFATLANGSLDGQLLVVSRDLQRAIAVPRIAPSLLDAMQRWAAVQGPLQDVYDQLDAATAPEGSFAFDPAACAAPLPRAPQWLDGSAFLNHSHLMDQAFNKPPPPMVDTVPMMYQGASDDFLGPCDDVPLPSEADGIDFEGEFGVVTGPVPMGVTPEAALGCVRLLLQINDWSLRALGPHEMKTGFGFLQAKPSTAFAPVAVTPDELGPAWRDGRVQLRLQVQWNGERFGEPHGGEMSFHFGQLIAHAARTRRLTAGCIIGSGTVSNAARSAGSACIAERRVIEKIDQGESRTGFMRFGDRVRMQAVLDDGQPGPFGVIDQRVVHAQP
ncbi:fumarylacetoacetate hydrolase family protein [Aquincola tertiaricarbonis]|uniref:Fumarylacetoacetate hydrolase family protein n=1 Tax=Aquincola tertiaricarbonis TaxID=391953 RepID=A0ABY4S850_AQUTE|nr:fumarylacetoacetate hydrolase family protein [Aquincola tertiaricarbonis]URI07266.1 fumarylacetoacetate hydrolase family protein [Aquincola tertiaricarbonis]